MFEKRNNEKNKAAERLFKHMADSREKKFRLINSPDCFFSMREYYLFLKKYIKKNYKVYSIYFLDGNIFMMKEYDVKVVDCSRLCLVY